MAEDDPKEEQWEHEWKTQSLSSCGVFAAVGRRGTGRLYGIMADLIIRPMWSRQPANYEAGYRRMNGYRLIRLKNLRGQWIHSYSLPLIVLIGGILAGGRVFQAVLDGSYWTTLERWRQTFNSGRQSFQLHLSAQYCAPRLRRC